MRATPLQRSSRSPPPTHPGHYTLAMTLSTHTLARGALAERERVLRILQRWRGFCSKSSWW